MEKQKQAGISSFQKYLTLWVFVCMVIGIVIGKFAPAVPTVLGKLEIAGISVPIAILIWVMIYPMMLKVDFQSVKQVATNDLIILIAFVPIVKFLLGVSNVSVPYSTLFISVILFVVIPLAGGILTRIQVVKQKGILYFEEKFVHKFDNVTTVGLLLTLVLIFFIAYIAAKLVKLPHDIAAPAGMIGASNFFELAVAVAIALFGTTSPAALATTVGVLTEVPVMLALVKVANSTKGWFKS